MTDNELIAEWLGAKEADSDLGNLEVGDIVLQPDRGRIVSVGYVTEQQGGKMVSYRPWSPDTDITLWPGPDGLLEEIEKKGPEFVDSFMQELHDGHIADDHGTMPSDWLILRATETQLTAVLVKMIEETE